MATAKLTTRLSDLAWLLLGAYVWWLPQAAIKMSIPGRSGDTPMGGKDLLILAPAMILLNEWRLWRTAKNPDSGWDTITLMAILEIALIGFLLAKQFGLA